MRRSLDDQLLELVRSLDAEKASVTISYDKDSWWTRRGKGTERKFEIELVWGVDYDDKRVFSGTSRSLSGCFEKIKAQVAAHLLKGSLDGDGTLPTVPDSADNRNERTGDHA